METLFFFIGFFVGIGATVLVISENKRDDDAAQLEPTMDDENEYYVKLPDREDIINIVIEEPLNLNHKISLDGCWYKVIAVEHNNNGHTIFILNWS
jgi:hypothetical protein